MSSQSYVCVYTIHNNEENNAKRWIQALMDADLVMAVSINGGKQANTSQDDLSIDKYHNNQTVDIMISEITDRKTNNLKYPALVLNELDFSDDFIDFSKAKNYALDCAKSFIMNHTDTDINDWIFISLDLDEVLKPGSIEKIKQNWDTTKYHTLSMIGITNDDMSNGQTVTHKIHGYNAKWVRRVHETIIVDGAFSESDIIFGGSGAIYDHYQDTSKPRNYYELLKREAEEENFQDAKTMIYLAWEALLHNDYYEGQKYAFNCLSIITTDKSSKYYRNPQYIVQSYLDIADGKIGFANMEKDPSMKMLLLQDAIRSYDSIISFLEQLTDYGPIQKVYLLAAETAWRLSSEIEDELLCRKYQDYAINMYKHAIDCTRNFDWWVDNTHISNCEVYSHIAVAYYYIINPTKEDYENAVIYASLAYDSANAENDNNIYDLNNLYSTLEFATTRYKEYVNYQSDNIEKENKEIEEMQGEKQNKICVYAISKNESQFVDKWIESMKEADYIVVLDTGSTDDTVEKLKAYPFVKVYEKTYDTWRFDVARNDALDLVPEDANILVSTDLDELLDPGWGNILRERWIDGVHERAIYKYSWSHMSDGTDGRVFQYDKVHSRNWRWKYPVHELLWNMKTDTNLYSGENILYIFDEMHLHHYPDRSKSRKSYLPLLELRASENKNDYYGLIYLAHEYYYQCHYEQSIATLNFVLENFKDHYTSVEQASCYLFMGDSYVSLENYSKAKDSYLSAIDIDKTYREPYLGLASVLIKEKDYDLAIAYIKKCLKETYRHYTWVERDTSWTYEPFDLLTLACFYGGNKKDALAYAAKAYSYDKTDDRLKQNIISVLENSSDLELL